MLPVTEATLIIKTLLRPRALESCLKSIREIWPTPELCPILVADDAPDPMVSKPLCDTYQSGHLPLSHDVGLSAGRNALIDAIETKYFVLLDDDFILTSKTDCPALVEFVRTETFDIAGGTVLHNGRVTHYEGRMWREGRTLCFRGVRAEGPTQVDICYNFFAGRTQTIREVRWDDRLKLCEHQAFFLRAMEAGLRVGYIPQVEVNHVPVSTETYNAYRKTRSAAFWKIFQALYNIDGISGSLSA